MNKIENFFMNLGIPVDKLNLSFDKKNLDNTIKELVILANQNEKLFSLFSKLTFSNDILLEIKDGLIEGLKELSKKHKFEIIGDYVNTKNYWKEGIYKTTFMSYILMDGENLFAEEVIVFTEYDSDSIHLFPLWKILNNINYYFSFCLCKSLNIPFLPFINFEPPPHNKGKFAVVKKNKNDKWEIVNKYLTIEEAIMKINLLLLKEKKNSIGNYFNKDYKIAVSIYDKEKFEKEKIIFDQELFYLISEDEEKYIFNLGYY